MEQRASSLQQRLEARRNLFLAQKSGEGGASGASVGGTQPTYVSSRTGRKKQMQAVKHTIAQVYELPLQCKPIQMK